MTGPIENLGGVQRGMDRQGAGPYIGQPGVESASIQGPQHVSLPSEAASDASRPVFSLPEGKLVPPSPSSMESPGPSSVPVTFRPEHPMDKAVIDLAADYHHADNPSSWMRGVVREVIDAERDRRGPEAIATGAAAFWRGNVDAKIAEAEQALGLSPAAEDPGASESFAVTVRIPPEKITEIDARAAEADMTRAAYLKTRVIDITNRTMEEHGPEAVLEGASAFWRRGVEERIVQMREDLGLPADEK